MHPTHEPVFPESLSDYRSSFRLFHGANGVVPLVRYTPTCDQFTTESKSLIQDILAGSSEREVSSRDLDMLY